MSVYLRREMRGKYGPYYRLEEKSWDARTGKLKTRQVRYYGKETNVPLELLEKFEHKGTVLSTISPQNPEENTCVAENPSILIEREKTPLRRIRTPETTAKRTEGTTDTDKNYVHALYQKYYGDRGGNHE